MHPSQPPLLIFPVSPISALCGLAGVLKSAYLKVIFFFEKYQKLCKSDQLSAKNVTYDPTKSLERIWANLKIQFLKFQESLKFVVKTCRFARFLKEIAFRICRGESHDIPPPLSHPWPSVNNCRTTIKFFSWKRCVNTDLGNKICWPIVISASCTSAWIKLLPKKRHKTNFAHHPGRQLYMADMIHNHFGPLFRKY